MSRLLIGVGECGSNELFDQDRLWNDGDFEDGILKRLAFNAITGLSD